MKLSIVIPVYNEVNTIRQILRIVENVRLQDGLEREIVIVDDYSTDGTRDLLKGLEGGSLKILYHERNMGKGAALRTGFSHCTGDISVVQDADLEYDPNEYPRLIAPILENEADIVYGSRFIGSDKHRVLYFWHSIGNRMLTLFSNMFTDLNLTDMETCYKAFRKNILDMIQIEENRFGFEPEITAKTAALAKQRNLRIYEIGISYKGRTYEEGKKIKFKDALRAGWCIWKYNITPFARAVKYTVHGILAILLQFILIAVLAGSRTPGSFFDMSAGGLAGAELSIIFAYLIHSRLTWNCKAPITSVSKIIRFHIVTILALVFSSAIFMILTVTMAGMMLPAFISLLIFLLLNYYGYGRFVFCMDKPC